MRKNAEFLAKVIFLVLAVSSSLVLVGILLLLAVYGLRTFGEVKFTDFLFGKVWNPDAYGEPQYGLIPNLWGTFLTTIIALLIALPTGILSALFLSERLKGSLRMTIKTIIELFAGFPSVVIGFFGLTLVAPLISRLFNVPSGLGVLNAGIILALMSLPTIITISDDALRIVPEAFREASYALGASKWQTSIKVVLPAAKSGIIAAGLLGFGRAVGETMAVLMVAGNAPIIARSLFDPTRTITSTIAIELGEVAQNTTHFFALFTLGLILFLISLVVNLLAESALKKERKVFL
ncbi:MAG: phosphate ABC transporter permease subunit PstC [candidate division WOR-3 bacterium]